MNNVTKIIGLLSVVFLGTLACLGSLLINMMWWHISLDPTGVAFAGVVGFLLSSLAVIWYGLLEEKQARENRN
jgi:Na+-driven multidrug efflux pump